MATYLPQAGSENQEVILPWTIRNVGDDAVFDGDKLHEFPLAEVEVQRSAYLTVTLARSRSPRSG